MTDPLGLVYLRARTYNPALGIFTQRDPALGVVGLSASYNGYGYVHGNPVNYRDPSGECPDGLDLFQCVAYDALDALNRASTTARQIIGIGAYVTATEVSPRAAAVGDWILEYSGTYDLLDDLSYVARRIDRDLLGNASQGTIQRGDMRRALQTILTQPYQSNAAFNQVRGDLEPSGWLVSLATLLYGARGVVNSITPTLRAMPQLSTSGQLALALQASVSIESAALIPAYMGARELTGNILRMSGEEPISDSTPWQVGDPIDQVGPSGEYPTWDTVRGRYWRNRAANATEGEFGPQNLGRMRAGSPPRARILVRLRRGNEFVIEERLVEKELHHIAGRRVGNPHALTNLQEVWPWEHAALDPSRRLGYEFLRFKP